ncbi:unnamed protein product [Orchesella dallaii]|uniref:Uncharacterized protein n=1 Tax=Orchesella dallaii TaxID=48710 RepID=A0ABP1PMU3_9HEXA
MDQGDVRMAVIAMQQLPKIHNAFSNMAKRSRRRLERKGIYLGGFWLSNSEEIPKQNGILKSTVAPNVGQLSTFNEFWRSFSNSCKTDAFDYPITTRDSWSINRPHRTSDFAPSPVSNRMSMSQSYIGNNVLCRSQTSALLESIPVQISNLESLKQIDLAYLKNNQLDSKENEIILELQHLKTLSNISFYKLLRKRPLEYVLPLPRKPPRLACTRAKSLVAYQSVPNLPTQNYKIKWLRFNTNNYKKNFSEFGNDPPRVVVLKAPKKGKFYYSTTIPKGVAFLTYPDSVDNNSFEGTIGGRNMISWEQGTKFPEMGVDQSDYFRNKKEMSRQNMMRSRLQAASIRKGTSVNVLNTDRGSSDGNEAVQRRHSFFYLPTKKSNSHQHKKQQRPLLKRLRRPHATQPQFKLSSFIWNPFRSKRSGQVDALSNHSNTDLLRRTQNRLPTHTEVARRFTCRRKAIVRAERRRRLKICLGVTVGFLSCGLIPLLTKGECMCRKRRLRTMRTEDSRVTEGSTFDGNQS